MRHLHFAGVLALVACHSNSNSNTNSSEGVLPGNGGTESPAPSVEGTLTRGLVVHEWGTFTSVSTSAGTLMQGMHHEEEALPEFVYARRKLAFPESDAAGNKGFEAQPVSVTQKLETPVVYFYSDTVRDVRLKVEFPKGILSEWYPNAASFGPRLFTAHSPELGFMEWKGKLVPGMAASSFPFVDEQSVWMPSRRVASVPIQIGEEKEQFIFYRGLGAFELPFKVQSSSDQFIDVHNPSSDVSPSVFLLRVHEGGGAIVELGSLAGGASLSQVPVPIFGKERNLEAYVTDAQNRIARALVETGLRTDEARAMVDTWTRSYFKTPGLRLLYVVPRAWTDRLLPMTIEPTPNELVRTLVGRVEVLLPGEEASVAGLVRDAFAAHKEPTFVIEKLGRFAEPKLRRAAELLGTDPATSFCQRAIEDAAAQP